MKTLLLLLLIPTISLANNLNSPLTFKKCSDSKIIQVLPKELKSRVKVIAIIVDKIATRLKVNPCVILSIVWTESTFKASQRSFKGANGLMQVMPRTASAMRLKLKYDLNKMISANLGYGLDFWEVENLVIGTYYYSRLLKRYNGSNKKALIAYNRGPTYMTNTYVNDNYFRKVSGKFNSIAINN